jgi:hypothetical protein
VEDKDIRHMGLWISGGGSGSGVNEPVFSSQIIPGADFFQK